MAAYERLRNWVRILTHNNMKKKDYHKPGYWKDWYWNKGGREKVQETRYIREYEREKKNRVSNVSLSLI